MPIYDLFSESTGRSYRVKSARDLSDEEIAKETERYDQRAFEAEQNKPFLDVTDLASGIGSALSGLTKTGPAAVQRMRVGFDRPDTYPEGAKKAFEAEKEYTDQLARENTYRLLTGDLGSAGESMRKAGGSLGFTAGSVGAAIPATLAGGAAGTALGGPVGGTIGGVSAGMAASAAAAYRMAGSQFLDDAYNTYLQNNPNISEAEKEAAYQELLPLAQESALWEAGPEAIGNAVTMGAGKVILGLGKNTVKRLAKSALGKVGLGVGAQATELATETVTQLGQDLPQAKAEAFNRGEDMAQAKGRYAPGMEGAVQALKDVGPQTLALGGLMLGAGGAYKGGKMALGLDKKAEPAPEAPTVEGTPVEEIPVDPLVAQARAAMAATDDNTGEEVSVDDLVQAAQGRFDVLQDKAADQTTPLTQEEADEMEVLTAAFADPANIDFAGLADMYNLRIAQPVVEEVDTNLISQTRERLIRSSAQANELLTRAKDTLSKVNETVDMSSVDEGMLAEVDALKQDIVNLEETIRRNTQGLADLDTLAPASVDPTQDPLTLAKSQPVGAQFTDNRGDVWEKAPTGWTLTSKQFEGSNGIETTRPMTDEVAITSIRDQLLAAPAPNPIAQNAINAANDPNASLPLTAALLNDTPGALNPPPTPQENAPTQEREIESPSGTPPVQGQPADQGANRQAPEGTPQREGEGQEVAPAGQGPQFSQGGQAGTQNQSPESLRHAELEAKFNDGTITPEETAEAEKLVAERSKKGGWDIDAKHGTTHNFFEFTKANANIKNNLGAGFYLSNTEDDVTENYAGVGPDLTNRIEKRAEQILNDQEDQPAYGTSAYKKKMEAAKKKAAKELSGGKQRVISAKVRFTNPVILDGNGVRPSGTIIELTPDIEQYRAEAVERVKENNPDVTDENIDDYSDEVQDAMYELQSEDYDPNGPMEKIRGVVDSFEGTDWGRVSEELSGEESLPAYRLEQLLRENEGTAYATDSESGDSAVGELIRQVFEALGYDGIIDKNVNAKFGSKSKGKPMAGMHSGTIHYIAFEPNQIKSAETFTGVPLDQRFNPEKADIRFSQAPQTPTGLPVEKVTTVVDQVMAKNKSPLQVRVITRSELENAPEFQSARDALDRQGADARFTEAWVDGRTQTVVVVADSFSSAARIREVLIHEIIGHAGVDAFASEADISRVLKILERRVPDLVNQVKARYPNLNDAGIAREVIAKFSEQYQAADFASLPSGMKALWRELKAWLGGIIQRLNVNIAAFDDLTLNWFYTNAVNAAAGITALPAAPAPAAKVAPAVETAQTQKETPAGALESEASEVLLPDNKAEPQVVKPEEAAAEVAPAAKKKLVLPPARVRKKAAPALVPAEAENPIGVANAVVDAARAKLGLPPVFAPIRQSFGALWDQALRAIAMNTDKGKELVEDLNKKSREISALETAILTHELVTRTLKFDNATEALNNATESEKETAREDYDRAMTKLQEAWNASDVSGTEQGRSLNARKMLAALDYTLAKMVSMRTAAAERPLSDEQRAQTEELFAKIDDLQKKLADLEKSGKTSGEEARLEDLLASAREEGKLEAQKEAKLLEEAAAILKAEEAARASAVKKGADPAKVLEDSVDAARARLRARKGLFGAKAPEVIQEGIADIQFSIADTGIVGLSAQDIADLTLVGKSYIAEGATTLESWSEKMIAEFGEDITDYLEPLYENSKTPVAAAPAAKAPKAPKAAPAEKAPKEKKLKASPMDRIKADAKEGKELSPKLVYELVKQKLQEGISGVENVFKAVTKDLQEEFPLMTEREIRDIFSGYGKPIFPSGEDLAKALRELRRLSQLTSALEDAKMFIIPLKSGQQRAAVTEAIRNLQKEIARVMQENNLVRSTTSKQLKSTLDSIKTRLRNEIVDLNAQIKKKEKAPKKAGVVYDQEANNLRAERNRLQEVLNNLVGPSQPSPSQRIRQKVNQLQKEITDLEKRVATRDITKPATQPVPETQLIQVLKDQKAALLEQLHVIRVEIEGEPSLTQEQVNERAIKAIERNMDDLDRRINEKDFSRKEGKQATGPIIDQLRAQQKALREQYNILRETIEGKREKTDQQKIDMADKALNKSIDELQRQIDTGNIGVKPKVAPIQTPELKAKRAQRDTLKKVRDGMRKAVKDALADPVAKQLARDKKNITRQIEKLRKRIADRDFSKPTKIARTTDQEKQDLEAKLSMLKSDWTRILFEEKLANRTTTQKLLGGVSQTLNTARAVLTSFDFSGVLRQGGFIVLGNPLRAIKNLRPMFAAFASKEAETKAKLALQKRPNFALYQRDKLFLADMDATSSMAKQEEAYASRWVDKIPWWMLGGLVRGSQRGYVTFLNNLRADSYDAMVLAFRKGPAVTQEESKAIVDYINIATGRGDLGKFSQAAEGLNTVFFAPRLVASRFQLLLGMPYFSATGRTKNLILQEYAKFLTGVAVVYMLGMLAQEDEDKPIETDPRSTNFGKIRLGNSRVDPLSGLQQVTVLLARLVSGQTKTSTGKIVDIRGENVPYGGATPVNIVAKFARSKFSPVIGSITNMVQGENVIGEKVTPFGELERMVVPMSFGEVGKVMEEQGVPKGMVLSTLALFGMGVQTYDETKKR